MAAIDVLTAIDKLSDKWVGEREDRFQRRHLDPGDFAAIAETGYLRLIVPVEFGGFWVSLAETGPILIEAVARLARGDQSVALVSAMSPSVLALWTATPAKAPEPHSKAWAEQREFVASTAMDGHFWGTLTSEPGSSGDIMKTTSTAISLDDTRSRYSLYGAKHFGSGSGLVSFMITTAIPEGLDVPLAFFMDFREQPWDGSAGLTITRPWDGVGMKATQSHSVMFEGVEGIAHAWQRGLGEVTTTVGSLGRSMFARIIAAIVDSAMAEAELKLSGRLLRPYDDVEWSHAQIEHWMLIQASEGLARSMAAGDPAAATLAAIKAKMGMAALAETILGRLSKVIGGGAYLASSPFACWHEDVRALGYLRPPWGLAFEHISNARPTET